MMQRYNSCQEFISALSNGTYVSTSGSSSSSAMITVGREKCDIILLDRERKISRHHADIELKVFTGGKYYLFTDVSSNGTWVNGKLISKESVSIPVSGPAPEILLAGVPEGRLNWNEVVARLKLMQEPSNVTDSLQPDNDWRTGEVEVVKEEAPEKKSVDEQVSSSGLLDSSDMKKEEDEDNGESATGLLIAGAICGVLGGLLGLVLGVMVLTSKTKDMDGKKVYKYQENHRKWAWGVIALAIASYFIWTMALL